MGSDMEPSPSGMLLGYARAAGGRDGLVSQLDALADAGVEPRRIYSDIGRGEGRDAALRPGLTALLDYARSGDTVLVVGIERLGRTTSEVLGTARILGDRNIGVRSLREGIDTADKAGAMVVGVLASLARLDDEPRQRRHGSARHAGGPTAGRPRSLSVEQVQLAERMRASGDSVPTIAQALGVSRATLYRSLAERKSAQ